jgi:hypothetical protein
MPKQQNIECDLCTGGPKCLNDCNIQAPGGCMAGDLRDDIPGKPYGESKAVHQVTSKMLANIMVNGYLQEVS